MVSGISVIGTKKVIPPGHLSPPLIVGRVIFNCEFEKHGGVREGLNALHNKNRTPKCANAMFVSYAGSVYLQLFCALWDFISVRSHIDANID